MGKAHGPVNYSDYACTCLDMRQVKQAPDPGRPGVPAGARRRGRPARPVRLAAPSQNPARPLHGVREGDALKFQDGNGPRTHLGAVA